MTAILFRIAAITLLVSTALFFITPFAAYSFAVSAAIIAIHNLRIDTNSMSVRQRRLHRLNIYASILMIVASALQFQDRNEWIVCLVLAAIFQLYAAWVWPEDDDAKKQ